MTESSALLTRGCPACGNELRYKSERSRTKAERRGSKCATCSQLAPIVDGKKACVRCCEMLPLDSFCERGSSWYSRCRPCAAEVSRIAWAERRVTETEAQRISERQSKRAYYMRRLYGVTIEWYEQTLENQGGRCAICGSEDHRRKKVKYFAVDHDHETGEARGLLCHPCNVGLGQLQDSTKILESAIHYLKERSK